MDQPTTLTELIAALAALPDLDPVERARRAGSPLQDATRAVLRGVRVDAILEATDPPHRITGVEVARRLGIHPVKVSEARKDALARGRARRA